MNSREHEKIVTMLRIAEEIAQLSRASRLKVGAVIAEDFRIISTGYNGTPHGVDNTCEIDGVTLDTVVHAEMNALLFAARFGVRVDGASMFVTHAPCFRCSAAILQAGIKKLYYWKPYHSAGIKLLENFIEVYEVHCD